MNFYEAVEMLSDKTIEQIRHQHQQWISDSAAASQERENRLDFLLHQNYLNKVWNHLTPAEQKLIAYFVFFIRDGVLTYRQVEQGLPRLPVSECRPALTLLRRKGMVFTVRRQWGELGYIMPEQLRENWRENLLKRVDPGSWNVSHLHEPPSFTHPYPSLIRDVFEIIVRAQDQALILTKKGSVRRQSIKQVMKALRLQDEALYGLSLKYENRESYTPREAVLFDYLLRHHLLYQVETENILRADLDVVAEWVNHDPHRLAEESFHWFRSCILPADVRVQTLLDYMLHVRKPGWYSLRRMSGDIIQNLGEDVLTPYTDHVNPPELEEQIIDMWVERALSPLDSGGWITVVKIRDDNGLDDYHWHWAPGMTDSFHTENEVKVYVQPQMEIMVPPVASLSLEWELSRFAELMNPGDSYHYKITRESVRNGIEKGLSEGEIVESLRQNSAIPLPDVVELTIRRWGQELNRSYFRDVRLIGCRDRSTADEWAQFDFFQEYTDRIGDRYFIVKEGYWDLLVEQLEQRGYEKPAPYVKDEPLKAAPSSRERTESLQAHRPSPLFTGRDRVQGYRVENVFPELDEAYPGLDKIPAMWWKHFRSYHESTLRDLVQQALKIQLPLKIKAGTRSFVVEPQSLVNEQGYWILKGSVFREQDDPVKIVEMKLNEIDRIQLIIPYLEENR